ncbi:AAA domain-containing protein [Thiothrix subterranea]|uniref:AAA domain-containing protein n=1 Tax=Thiothrix subterranea TaxID=2735563 RepID=A0AA51R6A9_9GAMM|nr:AAA domain-containing protein [Thiothrix subterranea]WML88730.1 AAA domain-containing protein [Thiothrix subterranea]
MSQQPMSVTGCNQLGNLYWRLPDTEAKNPKQITLERFGKSLKGAFRQYQKHLFFTDLLNLDFENRAEKFLTDFFLNSFDIAIPVNLANLSLQDNSDKRIALSIRIPFHPIFNNGKLPSNIAISVVGYCPTASQNPIFIPERVFLTHGQFEATSYESQVEVNFRQLGEGRYPERGQRNVLMPEFTKALPKYAVKTMRRLENWIDFLTFKENLIRQKTQGLRYFQWSFKEEKGQVELLVMAENNLALKQAGKAFNRQNLHAFDLKTSTCPYRFSLPQNSAGERVDSAFSNFGQLANNGLKAIQDNHPDKKLIQTCNSYRQMLKKEDPQGLFDFDKVVFANLVVEVSEELNNRISQLEDDVLVDTDAAKGEKVGRSRTEKINALFNKIPEKGFISISLVGDLSLVGRHRRAVNNLRQNEGCYAPYLSSYLFDITNANQPAEIPEITEWENQSLNEKQKSAVQKMLAAPDICLIQGPPGTGKTTVIAEACLQFAKRGESVLLASQAHDALDNALSRLQDNPNLRAIRLARYASRITDDGKEFTGENVLSKQYVALRNYLTREYLKPQDDLNAKIEESMDWLNQANYVVYDLTKLRDSYQQNHEALIQAQAVLTESQAQFDAQMVAYKRQQQDSLAMQQLIAFLESGVGANTLSSLTLRLPEFVYLLAEKLCGLQAVKIDQRFSYSGFLAKSENQLAILGILFSRWQWVLQAMPKMQLDLERLNDCRDGQLLDIQTKLKIDALEQEISVLAKRLEDEDDDDLTLKWKQKRREVRSLKENQASGLNGDYYQLFSDADRFTQMDDIPAVKSLLSQRLEELKKQKAIISPLTSQVITQLQQAQSQTTAQQPNESTVKMAQANINQLSEREMQLVQKSQQKRDLSKTLLMQSGFDTTNHIEDVVAEQKKQVEQWKVELDEIRRQNQDFQPLFHRWRTMLAEPEKRASADWNELKEPYIDSCNLVAISCNEDEKTLTNAGFDGFDVVIIDEVSKATPLELLLPLMRGKKAILVGDHRQLPPVFNEADGLTFEDEVEQNEAQAEEENQPAKTDLTKDNLHKFEKMVTASLFKELFEQAPDSLRERLNIQFRMHHDIMRMINFFYEGQLECGNPDAARLHGIEFKTINNRLLGKNDHLLWIDTTNDETGKHFSINQNQGNTNLLEARLIALTLVEINRQLEVSGEYGKNNKLKVGIVSFYQPQCRSIRDEIRSVNNRQLSFSAIDVEINTVIRYQGKEKPIILLSLVKNNGGDLNQKFHAGRANIARFEFINVAMSRAQNLLLVFGARNMLENREVKLPRMDRQGYDKKMVYKQMFGYLEHQTETGGLCEAAEFAQTLPIFNNPKK